MPRLSSVYVCQQCGFQSSQYFGKCPQCDSWNSFVEQVEQVGSTQKTAIIKVPEITNLADIKKQSYDRIGTKIAELDRVLGGGIVKGSVVLVSGDPGVGKSTLLTQLALNQDFVALYVAGEESAHQIKIRADRIRKSANLPVLTEVDVDVICEAIKITTPQVVIVDSIQTLTTADLNSPAGSVSQVRECASRLQRLAKSLHVPIFLVGHVTKEGVVAGPRTLEHLVDVVLSLEGDPTSQFRILRSNKNRFGPTDEVGIFDMEETGMVEVKNPSKLFLETKQNAPGSVVVPILTGLRPILVEIQALVTKTNLSFPRRTASGIDNNRLQVLIAVLQKRLKLPLYDLDVFVNVTGGLKIMEPAADLGICMSIISSYQEKIVPSDIAFVGEVGLLGELRTVSRIDKRVMEASKLGYKNVISPQNAKSLSQVVKMSLA